MRVKAKDLARLLLDLRETRQAADDWEAAASDQADTITEQLATIKARQQTIARYGLALSWLGTTCANNTKGRCWNDGRVPTSPHTANAWCSPCIAAWALGIDNPPDVTIDSGPVQHIGVWTAKTGGTLIASGVGQQTAGHRPHNMDGPPGSECQCWAAGYAAGVNGADAAR